ncbi:MAG: T9SS type A sorting domain-containing protein [Bacteroidetes bacterium]|jgi:hypothetical protein|nr:T9SS type A sorting domain-containing protein [Bacteroidota bacterium]MBT5528894.1 T9SS type A sorting domain-containing protein [Cytophagia bacterium]MBT3423984.1 T9SS type A sorting domain-containing protein [Bacteroidota bacterium]MBT3799872.1 T9SS type A sorting domain-containing protein [Bacteroidota bacterium]MBT3934327.1 T9SS type A sorting domain-containing protein [Bacteroidota bacterium]
MWFKKLAFSLLIIALCLQSFNSFSTHLISGNISYEYVGVHDSLVLYKITINMYRDCDASTTPFDASIQVGVYNNDTYRSRYSILNMNLVSEEVIDPTELINGGWIPPVCLRQGIYSAKLALPISNTGFHLTHIRCCKLLFTNLLDDQGMTLYQFIPPTNIINNAPFNANHQIVYSCAKFPNRFNLGIDDIDGDSIVLKVATPTAGGTAVDPIPTPSGLLFLPLQKANYRSPYTLNAPFGANSYATMHADQGDVSIYCPNPGYYCIAIDMKEYRNGVMISQSRFDVGIVSVLCDPNMLQMLNPIWNKFEIYAGESLEIPFQFYSAGKYKVKRKGEIFGDSNSGFKAPFAKMDSVYGRDTLESIFSWKTNCDQAREDPYVFQVEAISEDTFIQSIIHSIEIKVLPFSKPARIDGSNLSCIKSRGAVYSIHNNKQSYITHWEITGGKALEGLNSDLLTVLWDTISPWRVKAYVNSPFGCGNDSISMDVNITPYSKTAVIVYDTMCKGVPIFLQGKWQNQIGIYVDTFDGLFCCDSIVTTHLALKQLDVSVIKHKSYFKANLDDAEYQWYSCPSGFPIIGANNQWYSPTHTGIYAVIVSYFGCTDTSACFAWPHTGLEDLKSEKIKTYPNPSNGSKLIVDLGNIPNELGIVEIYDLMGRKRLAQKNTSLEQIIAIQNVSGLTAGMYMLLYRSEEINYSGKFEIR